MIADGKIKPQLESVEAVLRAAKLFGERQMHPKHESSAAAYKGLSYFDVYAKCISEFAYDFKLADQSILGFRYSPGGRKKGTLNFTYYEAPSQVLSYEEFVLSELDVPPGGSDAVAVLADFGESLHQDYELYLDTVGLKSSVTPVRYDYSANGYRAGVHPISHMHIGFQSSLRIGMKKVLNPVSFTLFVIRQHYPDRWVELRECSGFSVVCKQIRANLDAVHADFWSSKDEIEMYLF